MGKRVGEEGCQLPGLREWLAIIREECLLLQAQSPENQLLGEL